MQLQPLALALPAPWVWIYGIAALLGAAALVQALRLPSWAWPVIDESRARFLYVMGVCSIAAILAPPVIGIIAALAVILNSANYLLGTRRRLAEVAHRRNAEGTPESAEIDEDELDRRWGLQRPPEAGD